MGLAQDMVLKFDTIVAKGLKLKGFIHSYVCKSYREKLVGVGVRGVAHPILNRAEMFSFRVQRY